MEEAHRLIEECQPIIALAHGAHRLRSVLGGADHREQEVPRRKATLGLGWADPGTDSDRADSGRHPPTRPLCRVVSGTFGIFDTPDARYEVTARPAVTAGDEGVAIGRPAAPVVPAGARIPPAAAFLAQLVLGGRSGTDLENRDDLYDAPDLADAGAVLEWPHHESNVKTRPLELLGQAHRFVDGAVRRQDVPASTLEMGELDSSLDDKVVAVVVEQITGADQAQQNEDGGQSQAMVRRMVGLR